MASPIREPSTFLELLPAKAYVRPEEQERRQHSGFNPDTGLAKAEEVAEILSKRRSSSTSTMSSIASANDGEKRQFLPLATLPQANDGEER